MTAPDDSDRAFFENALRDYHERGARAIGVAVHPDACTACARHRGRVYNYEDVPVLPIAECERSECRCDYQPAM
jgi:hypothetical protein